MPAATALTRRSARCWKGIRKSTKASLSPTKWEGQDENWNRHDLPSLSSGSINHGPGTTCTSSSSPGLWPTPRRPWNKHHSHCAPWESSKGRVGHRSKSRSVRTPSDHRAKRGAGLCHPLSGWRQTHRFCEASTPHFHREFGLFASLSYCVIVYLG